jgi:oxygen-independent coproporphyrinogen-3 oxidase
MSDGAQADAWLEVEALARAGFSHYEISNWALPGQESRHNVKYWKRFRRSAWESPRTSSGTPAAAPTSRLCLATSKK